MTGQRGVKDDAATPNVHGRFDVYAIGYDKFWSGIKRGPTSFLHEFIVLVFEPIRETEIRDYHVPLPTKEVFEFEIAMDDLFW